MVLIVSVLLTQAPVSGTPDVSPPAQSAAPQYVGWSREMLEAERRRVDELRPSLGLPIALTAAGGGVAVVSIWAMVLGELFHVFKNNSILYDGMHVSPGYVAVWAVIGTLGVATLVTGLAILFPRLAARRSVDPELRNLDERIDALPEGAAVVPPPPALPAPAP